MACTAAARPQTVYAEALCLSGQATLGKTQYLPVRQCIWAHMIDSPDCLKQASNEMICRHFYELIAGII